MSDQEDADADESLAQRRSRRSRNDKTGRLAALEKLKNAREGGGKNKYEVKQMENVYDVVDEDTYSRKVNDRLQDDWIVDDGTGYCETGHELFDDDLVDEDGYGSSKKRNKAKPKKVEKEEMAKNKAGFVSIRDMMSAMPAKRKREPAQSSSAADNDVDDLLGEMMKELHEEKKPRKSIPSGSSFSLEMKELHKEKKQRKVIPRILDVNFECMTMASSEKSKNVEEGGYKNKYEPYEVKQIKMENVYDVVDEDTSGPIKDDTIVDDETGHCETGHEFFDDDLVDEEGYKSTKKKTEPKKVIKEEAEKNKASFVSIEDSSEFQIQDAEMPSKLKQEPAQSSSTASNDDSILNFFWFDIYEEPKNPGVLYLFGKVASQSVSGAFVSCCVVIQNVQRTMFILPRDKLEDGSDVTFVDVFGEFESLAPKLKIPEFKAKKVEKKYCFGEENVPSISEYMEVCYSGSLPPLPEDFSGKTFSRVFGTHSSMLENFLLTKKFKGPCWLQINSPVKVDSAQQQSWCKIEFTSEVRNIQINPKKDAMPVPPFVVASLNINAVNDASTKRDTIICVSVVINKTFKIQSSVAATEGLFHDSFCLIHKPHGEVWPFDVDRFLSKFTTKMDSERNMLSCFLAKLAQYDPDIYIGHDLNFDMLLLQLWGHKVPYWSKIGRLKRSSQPQKGGKMPDAKSALAGRVVCDVKISAMELIRARSYDLPSLATQVLGLGEDQVSSYTGTELRQLFETSEGIQHLAAWGMSMSILNLRLVNELQVMPLALQITTIAGNSLPRTLMGGRSERNEFLLLHAFFNKGYIVPDKHFRKRFKREDDDQEVGNEKKGKSGGPSYVGGLVLDPKKGFYDNFIVLMDFNSLYPSIIQEFNICFTTSTNEENTDETGRGILPEEIRKLVESRREVKKLMQAENVSLELKRQYDIRQKALKLTANSMYGCLGFRNSRFYAKNLAALITGKGRDILLKTKEAVEKMGFEVIYGDTDSLMINTNSQEIEKVYKIGNQIKLEINRTYRLLELEIDGVFRFLLLLKKKKYAAMIYNVKPNGEVETSLELKGLDMVRRDWAPIAAKTARSVLNEIMTEQAIDDKIYKIVKILADTAEELREGRVAIKDLLITKQLAKNPEEYKGRQGLYHVEVALKMNKSGKFSKKFKNGDTVPYLFCKDKLPHHPAELMESRVKAKPEEVKNETDKKNAVLEYDPEYYLSSQVHPVVSRICEPIPGLDGARIAEALGMDPTSYKKRRVVENNQEDMGLGEMSESEKYKDCEKFNFKCAGCREKITLESPVILQKNEPFYTLSKCPNEKCSKSLYDFMPHICNSLVLFIRRHIQKYYEGWFECEDPACTNRERAINLKLYKGYMPCLACNQGVMVKDYTDFDLHKQLSYLLYAFDVLKRIDEFNETDKKKFELFSDECKKAVTQCAHLSKLVEKQLKHSAYSEIKLGDLFAELIPKSSSFGFRHAN